MQIRKHIPNILTCCNLISGGIAVQYAAFCKFDLALLCIVIGATFDFFDGMVARLLKVSSPIGKELDSLADVITFGLAPAVMLQTQLWSADSPGILQPIANYYPAIAMIMAACSALRLAKFNLDARQATSFIGLPTPANALFWASLLVGMKRELAVLGTYQLPLLVVLLLLTSWLLLAEIPMFALKFKHWGWKGNEIRYIFLLSCIPLLVFLGIAAFAPIILWYVFLSVIVNRKKQNS